MGHRTRQDHAGGWFHVMNRGVDHQAVFHDDVDRVDFGRLLGVGSERFGIEVHAYCLMSNHFHLLLHCPGGGLSAFMHDVTGTFARHLNDRLGRDGSLFRGRFRSLVVDSDAYILCATRYIHRNPLDIAGVTDVSAHRWSSHRTYLGYRRRPPWLEVDDVLGYFGGDIAAFDAFVRGDETTLDGYPIDGKAASALIDLVIEEHLEPTPTERTGLRRVVAMLAHAEIASAGTVTPFDGMVPATDGAYRTALSRARSRAATEPRIRAAVEHLRRLTV